MKYYIVAELNITDHGWVRDYVKNVTAMVERCGGRYLARTNIVEHLEGDRSNPHVFLILEWPSEEAARAFYDSEEYRPYLESRLAGCNGDMALVAGEDVNKVAGIV